jgi:predicted lipoprotein
LSGSTSKFLAVTIQGREKEWVARKSAKVFVADHPTVKGEDDAMNTFTQIPAQMVRRAIGAAIMIAVPFAATASDDDGDDIIVRSQPALEQWKAETSRDLDRQLARAPTFRNAQINNAIVQVTFSAGEDGRPTDVELYRSDGNWAANKIALRAVGRLHNLDEVPVVYPQDAQFIANIIFATSDRNYARLSDKLEKSEQERMASSGAARTFIALGN